MDIEEIKKWRVWAYLADDESRAKVDWLIAEVERLSLIVSGKTFYDVQNATAERCSAICLKQNTVRMAADAIRKEFGIGGE